MASLMLARASARVLPCEMQPGSAGHCATNTPSSSGSITTRYFILLTCDRSIEKSTEFRVVAQFGFHGKTSNSKVGIGHCGDRLNFFTLNIWPSTVLTIVAFVIREFSDRK